MEERPCHPGSGAHESVFLWEQWSGSNEILWEQSLLAMNNNAVLLIDRGAAIASKFCSHRVCSHRLAPTVEWVYRENFLSAFMDCTWT
ncbi:hypothetical protein CVG87_11775 [Pseudomonas sp. WCS365]|nr:hypothetical protein CVG87_11775 [Pseudomonas sp. WCS365]